jgi:SET domain-containing protein
VDHCDLKDDVKFQNVHGQHAALCTVGSLFNHSCDSNCTWAMSSIKSAPFIGFLVTRPIKAGESLTINYGVGINDPTALRQKALAPYGFKCACSLCATAATASSAK